MNTKEIVAGLRACPRSPLFVEAADEIESLTYKLQAAFELRNELDDLCLPKVKPSCLVCGRDDYDEPAIKHLTLGAIVVCPRCHGAASRLDAVLSHVRTARKLCNINMVSIPSELDLAIKAGVVERLKPKSECPECGGDHPAAQCDNGG